MPPLSISAFYISLAGVWLTALQFRVIMKRFQSKVDIGSGGNEDLERRIRVHGNASETIPLTAILMAVSELNGALSPTSLIWIGRLWLISKLLHAWGLGNYKGASPGRAVGTTLNTLINGIMMGATFFMFF